MTVEGYKTVDKEQFKDTSTKRVIILAHVDDIPENYHNISIILEKLNIHQLYMEYKLVSDLKLYNILLGLTSCSFLKQGLTTTTRTKKLCPLVRPRWLP